MNEEIANKKKRVRKRSKLQSIDHIIADSRSENRTSPSIKNKNQAICTSICAADDEDVVVDYVRN